jgi:phosphoribosylanthranilate isomerase
MPVQVKICGLTRLEDARVAVSAGADLLGFIFYPKSPRYVTPAQVGEILAALGQAAARVTTVGVFVNERPETVLEILTACGLHLAQLHGEEAPEQLGITAPALLRGRAYKALRPRSPEEAQTLAERYARPAAPPAFLIDTYQPTQLGGTGQTGDWQAAAALAARYPLLLAGGLTPGNVQQAVQAVKPWGVDVSSGVECAPGQKDHAAVREFVRAAKENAQNLPCPP